MTLRYSITLIAGLLALSACQSNVPPPKGVKIGKPYSIMGKTYYPAYDPTYDEEGVASWYGPGFHGKSTATGETYDMHDLTAAHPTLPMPSLVRVTNLDNGRALVVRVNDRGPFAKGRIIDLSKESAKRLGITGLGRVRVQYLVDESNQYIAALNEGRPIDMFAYNDRLEKNRYASLIASTAPSESSFIIEEHNNISQPGDTVSAAAPIMSVQQSSGSIFIRDAAAEEPVNPKPPTVRGGEVVLRSPSLTADEFSPPPRRAPEPPVAGGYYIQVGSFSQQANAQAMRQKVAAYGPVDVFDVEISGHRWWRVRSGPFATDAEATSALVHIQRNVTPDARKVRQ